MKFGIDSTTFKTIVKKLGFVIPKVSTLQHLQAVKITTILSGNKVAFTATDVNNHLTLSDFGGVYENGCEYVMYSDLKKVQNINGYITVTSNKDMTITFSANGRKYKIRTYPEYESLFPDIPDIKPNETVNILKDSVFPDIKNLFVMASKVGSNDMMAGVFWDLKQNRLIALDGHRIGVMTIQMEKGGANNSFIASEDAMKILISIVDRSTPDKIKVSIGKKYVLFESDRFSFATKAVAGDYWNIDNMFLSDYAYKTKFVMDTKKMSDTARDYKSALNGSEKRPMLITSQNGYLTTSIRTDRISITDDFEDCKVYGEDMTIAVNPQFIIEALNLIGECRVDMLSRKAPLHIHNESMTRRALVLPVNFVGN